MGFGRAITWAVVACMCCAVAGCARRDRGASRHRAERPATPADAPLPPKPRPYGEGALPPGWKRYVQRKTIPVGQTVTAGPVPYAKVKLVEVDQDVAVFEATHLVDSRRGRVSVGQTFNEFTPIFGKRGATVEALDASGATVVFRWTQNAAAPVPPGAVPELAPAPAPQ